MSHNRKMIRRKGIKWEYNGDGGYSSERIKDRDKKYWQKWLRRYFKRLTNVDLETAI